MSIICRNMTRCSVVIEQKFIKTAGSYLHNPQVWFSEFSQSINSIELLTPKNETAIGLSSSGLIFKLLRSIGFRLSSQQVPEAEESIYGSI